MDQMACLEIQVWLGPSHRDNSQWVVQGPAACLEVDPSNLLKLKIRATHLLCSCPLLKASRKADNSSKWAARVKVKLRVRHKASSRF